MSDIHVSISNYNEFGLPAHGVILYSEITGDKFVTLSIRVKGADPHEAGNKLIEELTLLQQKISVALDELWLSNCGIGA